MKASNRQNAKERRMEHWVIAHPRGKVRPIARRVSYRTAVLETRECRAMRPDCRFVYVRSASVGYNVVELES
jgi:hypothetical protein